MTADPAQIAKGLTEAQRDAWISTMLAVVGTDFQRRAFIAGYNGEPCPPYARAHARQFYEDGKTVRAHLQKDKTDEG